MVREDFPSLIPSLVGPDALNPSQRRGKSHAAPPVYRFSSLTLDCDHDRYSFASPLLPQAISFLPLSIAFFIFFPPYFAMAKDKTFQLFPTWPPSTEENVLRTANPSRESCQLPFPLPFSSFCQLQKSAFLSLSLSAISRFTFPFLRLSPPLYDLYVGRQWRRRRGPPLPASWLLGPFLQRGRRKHLLPRRAVVRPSFFPSVRCVIPFVAPIHTIEHAR